MKDDSELPRKVAKHRDIRAMQQDVDTRRELNEVVITKVKSFVDAKRNSAFKMSNKQNLL